jgi:cytochrome c biogenesis protein CcmG/thiol:disulfide interchange protein DsbE
MISPGRAHRLALTLATVLLVGGCINQPSLPSSGSSATLDDRPPGEPQLPVTAPNVQSCSKIPQASAPASSGSTQRLLDINLPCLIEGPAINPARLSRRPMVVNLWATWCQPCREEMPMLQAAQKRYGARVQFVGVNTKDQPDWAAEFLQEVNVTYPQVVDFDGELLASVRSPGLPVTLVLDGQGEIAGRKIGRISEELLTDLVDKVAG